MFQVNKKKLYYPAIMAFILVMSSPLSQACVSYTNDNLNLIERDFWTIYKGPIKAATDDGIDGIFGYDAIKQVRAWNAIMANTYTVMSLHEDNALDYFGRDNSIRRRCKPQGNNSLELLRNRHAVESFAYSYLWSLITFVPEWQWTVRTYATSIGVDLDKCTKVGTFDCGYSTPFGLAHSVLNEYVDIFANDGWNAKGSMTKTYNRLEFEDWRETKDQPDFDQKCGRNYKPMQGRCSLLNFFPSDNVCWKPNKYQLSRYGPIYQSRFRAKHVADSGWSFFLSDEKICEAQMDYPCYDMDQEGKKVYEQLATLNDLKKARIEVFHNVFRVFNEAVTQKFDNYRDGLLDWDIMLGMAAVTAAMYENTLWVWKEKIRMGLSRPRGFIERRWKDDLITTYRGPNAGIGGIHGDNFLPYVQDSFTAEYPSHISCMCTAMAQGFSSYLTRDYLGTTVRFRRAVGSSTVEFGHPTTEQVYEYTTWGSIESACHEARLQSGNHFSKANDGKDQCKTFTQDIVNVFKNFNVGRTPSYVPDVRQPEQRQHPTNRCTSDGGSYLITVIFGKNNETMNETFEMNETVWTNDTDLYY